MNKQINSIEKARLARGLTQQQAADIIGVSRPTYNNIENCKKDLTLTQAKSLAIAFRISLEEIVGSIDGAEIFCDPIESVEKYKQIILNSLKFGADADGKITKTKLAKLAYLADFIWYYIKNQSMSQMQYRRLPQGPVADIYFRALDEMEENGLIIREPKGKAILFSLIEENAPTDKLSKEELALINKIGNAWKGKATQDLVDFTHEQLPWQICRDGEIIPYGLITQEEPEKVYGDIKL
ncbi:MAG: helix-turn-helix domain-containing protein [Endomicrobium sp.]|jgi:DNA-binding XRE family transcriptional regulator/uncharacterized phage-associated protein|nr:helix-turn-helix domain-containing protein [Endomicrobium sp.]